MVRKSVSIVIGSAVLFIASCDRGPAILKTPTQPTVAATQSTTVPATGPTTKPVAELKPLKELLDVVRRNDENFPTTQPLDEPIELTAAARLRLAEPVYLCSRGDLWITRADAPPTESALHDAGKLQTHVVRETIRFVYWRPGSTWSPELVAREGDHDVWITPTQRLALDSKIDRDWSRAQLWNSDRAQAVVVPSTSGMSIISVADGKLDEQFISLTETSGPGVSTQAVFDLRGVLAWSIRPGADSSVARFVDGKWTLLTPSPLWPKQLLHVVPFLDGTLLAISKDANELKFRSVLLDSVGVDEANVTALVKKLADRNPKTREQAQLDIAAIGPGAWPILAKLQSAQPAEARVRIRALLADQTTPTLGGVTPAAGPGRMVCRLTDGGVVLYFAQGVSAVDTNGVVQTTTPAWLAVRPSQLVLALPEPLTRDLDPAKARMQSWGDEWILEHDVDGPMRWMGNHNETLTKKTEREFKRFVGIDAASRWIFKTIDPNGATLIVDPTLPDPRPKLPVWTVNVGGGQVGWTDEGWPVMERGGAWVLKDGAWASLKGDNIDQQFKTSVAAPATQSTTQSTPLLVDSKGNRYTGGLSSLTVDTADGRHIEWPIPPEAIGEGVNGQVVLIESDNKLFLCNSPGKLVRLSTQFDKPDPFRIDAVFTRHLPATDIRRIWKDPAGRLVIASAGNTLSIAFPSGRIPGAMSNMIPAGALRDALEGENDDK